MNAPLETLDKALTYTKNVVITCAGSLTWDSTAKTLNWDAPMQVRMIDEVSGKMHINTITSDTLTLSTYGDVVYVAVTTVNGTSISATFTSYSTGSTVLRPSSIIVLGMLDTTSMTYFYPAPILLSVTGRLA